MLCVFITFCSNGVSYESSMEVFFCGEGLDLVPHNFLGCLSVFYGKEKGELPYLNSLPLCDWIDVKITPLVSKALLLHGCVTECSDIAQSLSNTDFFSHLGSIVNNPEQSEPQRAHPAIGITYLIINF